MKEEQSEKLTYILILEGTFSDDMTTTGMSFQEDPYMCKQDFCLANKGRKRKGKDFQ